MKTMLNCMSLSLSDEIIFLGKLYLQEDFSLSCVLTMNFFPEKTRARNCSQDFTFSFIRAKREKATNPKVGKMDLAHAQVP